jgi:CheY-like chemotaxis protein
MAHILLAEDDEALASFLTKSLKRAGHRVTFARDGLEAYEKLIKDKFDLLLTDLAMPGMDGIDLVKKRVRIYRIYQ